MRASPGLPKRAAMTPRFRLGLAFAAGALAATGFAPLGLWPLTVVALAVLVWLLQRAPTRRAAFATGWWFGWSHFGVGLTWIATAFTFQAAMPPVLGWVAVVLLAMFLAIYIGLATLVAWSLARRPGPRVLLLAVSWMLAEWLRGHLLSGFAWGPLGVAWLNAGAVAQLASVFGGLGLSGLMVLAGGGLALAAQRSRRTGAAALVGICGIAALTGLLLPTAPVSKGPMVHLVQADIGQSTKYDPALEVDHFRRYLNLTRGALAAPEGRPPAIVAWPEAAIGYPVEEDREARAALASVLHPGDLLLFGGEALIRNPAGDVTAATNSLFVIDSAARLHGRYDKAHLVPLGEYVPMRPLMTALGLARLTPGDLDFLPGPGPRTLALPGFADVGVQICYEIIFPGEVVDPAHRPKWLLNVSNDAWFGASGPPQHLAQSRLRAIEEGLPVARATPTGISALVDARGRIVAQLGQNVMGVVSAALPPPLPPTLFAQYGHWTSLVFALLLLLAAAWAIARPI